MVKKLEKGHKRGHPGIYPWAKWFARRKFVLVNGTDFKCQPHGMVQMIRNRAGINKVKVSLSVHGNGDVAVLIKKAA